MTPLLAYLAIGATLGLLRGGRDVLLTLAYWLTFRYPVLLHDLGVTVALLVLYVGLFALAWPLWLLSRFAEEGWVRA